jgi:hypothetical protein
VAAKDTHEPVRLSSTFFHLFLVFSISSRVTESFGLGELRFMTPVYRVWRLCLNSLKGNTLIPECNEDYETTLHAFYMSSPVIQAFRGGRDGLPSLTSYLFSLSVYP